jgi:hypothetical protein
MQDRYAGDVGDFGKFLLLKALFSDSIFCLGVVWYLVPDDDNNDGLHISYVNKSDYLNCDVEICNKLKKVIMSGQRSVKMLERARLLPLDTEYFSERLDFHFTYTSQSQLDKNEREKRRETWLNNAISAVSKCNVVFLDPDNGLQIDSCKKIHQIKAHKFSYYSEISKLAEDKHSTVIYHHLNRHDSHANQIETRVNELRKEIKPTGKIFAVRFRPYSPRAYFILTDSNAENCIRESLMKMLSKSGGKFWDSFYEEKLGFHVTEGFALDTRQK